jgi:hypothetical protein
LAIAELSKKQADLALIDVLSSGPKQFERAEGTLRESALLGLILSAVVLMLKDLRNQQHNSVSGCADIFGFGIR